MGSWTQYNMAQYNTAQYNTKQYNAVQDNWWDTTTVKTNYCGPLNLLLRPHLMSQVQSFITSANSYHYCGFSNRAYGCIMACYHCAYSVYNKIPFLQSE